jgi:phosphoglycerate kinase
MITHVLHTGTNHREPLSGLVAPARPLPTSGAPFADLLGVNNLSTLGSLHGKTVVLRVDANVSPQSPLFPFHPRIQQVASTLNLLCMAGARTIVISHRSLGDDSSAEKVSNKEIVHQLRSNFSHLASTLTFHEARDSERLRTSRAERSYFGRLHTTMKELPAGHALFLENIRLFPSEGREKAQWRLNQLTKLVDYLVYDGFGVGHRGGHFSVDGLLRAFPYERKCLGPAALQEWERISSFAQTARPSSVALILGGDVDKFESKLKLVIEMLKTDRVGLVYLGGVFGTSWLHAHGCDLGRTPVSRNARALEKLRELPNRFPNVRFTLPKEYVGLSGSKELCRWTVSPKGTKTPNIHLPPTSIALDQSKCDLSPLLTKREISHVVAVGPLGYYAVKPFDTGTVTAYQSLTRWVQAAENRKLIVGGGNSMEALLDIPEFQTPPTPSMMISSGGGALLNALAEAFKVSGDPSLIQTPSIQALRRTN